MIMPDDFGSPPGDYHERLAGRHRAFRIENTVVLELPALMVEQRTFRLGITPSRRMTLSKINTSMRLRAGFGPW